MSFTLKFGTSNLDIDESHDDATVMQVISILKANRKYAAFCEGFERAFPDGAKTVFVPAGAGEVTEDIVRAHVPVDGRGNEPREIAPDLLTNGRGVFTAADGSHVGFSNEYHGQEIRTVLRSNQPGSEAAHVVKAYPVKDGVVYTLDRPIQPTVLPLSI